MPNIQPVIPLLLLNRPQQHPALFREQPSYDKAVDAPKRRAIKAFELLGFRHVREREHIAMVRENPDDTRTPLTMPDHTLIKGSTLITICTQASISRNDFLKAYVQT